MPPSDGTEDQVVCRWCGLFSAPGSACEVCGSPLSDIPWLSLPQVQVSVDAPRRAIQITLPVRGGPAAHASRQPTAPPEAEPSPVVVRPPEPSPPAPQPEPPGSPEVRPPEGAVTPAGVEVRQAERGVREPEPEAPRAEPAVGPLEPEPEAPRAEPAVGPLEPEPEAPRAEPEAVRSEPEPEPTPSPIPWGAEPESAELALLFAEALGEVETEPEGGAAEAVEEVGGEPQGVEAGPEERGAEARPEEPERAGAGPGGIRRLLRWTWPDPRQKDEAEVRAEPEEAEPPERRKRETLLTRAQEAAEGEAEGPVVPETAAPGAVAPEPTVAGEAVAPEAPVAPEAIAAEAEERGAEEPERPLSAGPAPGEGHASLVQEPYRVEVPWPEPAARGGGEAEPTGTEGEAVGGEAAAESWPEPGGERERRFARWLRRRARAREEGPEQPETPEPAAQAGPADEGEEPTAQEGPAAEGEEPATPRSRPLATREAPGPAAPAPVGSGVRWSEEQTLERRIAEVLRPARDALGPREPASPTSTKPVRPAARAAAPPAATAPPGVPPEPFGGQVPPIPSGTPWPPAPGALAPASPAPELPEGAAGSIEMAQFTASEPAPEPVATEPHPEPVSPEPPHLGPEPDVVMATVTVPVELQSRCPRCGEPSPRGLCEACEYALLELRQLMMGDQE